MELLAQGNSMFPTLKSGLKYEMHIVSEDDISVNDIIAFWADEKIICHRVIKVLRLGNKKIFYKTKGDNCDCYDPFAVPFESVIGKVIL